MTTWRRPMMMLALVLTISSLATAYLPTDSDSDNQVSLGPKFKKEEPGVEAFKWMFTEKRKGKGGDVTLLDIDWVPKLMLEDESVEDVEFKMTYQFGNEAAIEAKPQTDKSGKLLYSSLKRIPCLEYRFQLHAENSHGSDVKEVIVPASTLAEIRNNIRRFTVDKVDNVQWELVDNGVKVTWDPVYCATHYEVSFNKAGSRDYSYDSTSNTHLVRHGLEGCVQYKVEVVPFIETEEYSDVSGAVIVNTPPGDNVTHDLSPELVPGQHSVSIKIPSSPSLSCVHGYSVTLCNAQDNCQDPVIVKVEEQFDFVEYVSKESLDQCSDYTAVIAPVYDNMKLASKTVSFRTLSPGVSDVVTKLGPVAATWSAEHGVTVTWSMVQCASVYHVYRQQVGVDGQLGELELLAANHSDSMVSVTSAPCSEYSYSVSAVIDGLESDLAQVEDTVKTPLQSDTFSAPNLNIDTARDSVFLAWDHGSCIQSYLVTVCKEESQEVCRQETVSAPELARATVTIPALSPCTQYTLQISATTADTTLNPDTQSFMTKSPPPTTPDNFAYTLIEDGDEEVLTWEPVQCADHYNIYRQSGDEEEGQLYSRTEDNRASFNDGTPCTETRFAVAAVVGEQEGPRTEFLGGMLPPRYDERSKPSLAVVDKFNKTVVFQLNIPAINQKCQAEYYQVNYKSLGKDVESLKVTNPISELHEDKIVLDNFPEDVDKGFSIVGRLKYKGFDSWSPWIENSRQERQIKLEEGNGVIVPIVIGALIAVVVLVVVVFFFLKRKAHSNKYNCDRSEKSENARLNGPEEA